MENAEQSSSLNFLSDSPGSQPPLKKWGFLLDDDKVYKKLVVGRAHQDGRPYQLGLSRGYHNSTIKGVS